MPGAPFQRHGSPGDEPPPFGRTVLEDLSRSDFQRTIPRDLKDVYEFYLDRDTRDRLSEMGPFRRWLYMTFWLLKSSVLKLTPERRLLLLGSILVFLHGIVGQIDGASLVLGFVILLLILVLELKDKLLAQDELATGRAVQFALLPRQQPVWPGWEVWLFTRPANEVGGDLVDYLTVRPDRLGVALGDVAGKGLGAALFMAKLQATLRAVAPSFSSLSELGREINKIFCRDGLPSRFVSLVYLELKADADRVRFLNAGHSPPIAIGKDRMQEMPKGGAALGLMPGATYAEQCVELGPDELLLVYSDGLTEARNEQGEFFGRQRLLELLPGLRGFSAEAAGTRLLAAVDRFIGETRPSDDLSLMLLKRVRASQPAQAPAVKRKDEPVAAPRLRTSSSS